MNWFQEKPSACAIWVRQQFGVGIKTTLGIGAIDAFHGDREHTVFESSYPAFCFQIPEMKLQMLARQWRKSPDWVYRKPIISTLRAHEAMGVFRA